MRRHSTRYSTALLILALATGCSVDDGRTLDPPTFPLPDPPVADSTLPPEPTAAPPFQLVASWRNGTDFPARHTCDGEDVSPALSWSNVPAGTVELAITVTDLDADNAAHWIVYGIPPTTGNVLEDQAPDGAFLWENLAGDQAWAGPCPPVGLDHLIVVTVHALNQQLEVADDAPASEVIATLNAIAIAQSSVSGSVVRSG